MLTRKSSFFPAGIGRTIFCVMFLASVNASAQKMAYKGYPSLIWPALYNIDYVKGKDNLGEFQKPVFSKDVKALAGKQITLPGYIVPFENGIKSSAFMFSSLPLNACFFCGVGGPETVVQIKSKQPVSYTEKPVEIKGILRLNDSDPDQMIYTLEQAEFLGEIEF